MKEKKKRKYVNCAVYYKQPGKLSYIIAEHSGIGPIDYLKNIIDEYKFAILFLGCDGPSLLSIEESKRLKEGMKRDEIYSSLKGKFLWVSYEEIVKLYQKDWFTLFGDALLLITKDIEEDFECTRLPEPSGFNKDKISRNYTDYLNSILTEDDIYILDDFNETFIVTKNLAILDKIKQIIDKISNNENK